MKIQSLIHSDIGVLLIMGTFLMFLSGLDHLNIKGFELRIFKTKFVRIAFGIVGFLMLLVGAVLLIWAIRAPAIPPQNVKNVGSDVTSKNQATDFEANYSKGAVGLVDKILKESVASHLRQARNPSAKLSVEVYSQNSEIHTSFCIEHTTEFEIARHDMRDAANSCDLTQVMVEFLSNLQKLAPGENLRVDCFYHGVSDNLGFGKSGIVKYSGSSIIPPYEVDWLGNSGVIYPGDRVSNKVLAFLRAYSLFEVVKEYGKAFPEKVHFSFPRFSVVEQTKVGPMYRSAKVVLKLSDPSLLKTYNSLAMNSK